MSWTIVRGHRPVGSDRELRLDDQGVKVTEMFCRCGESRYSPEHIAALVED
ncbi:MAG: hypothetical protein JOZ49_05215 [Mycolicibacterium sp.]|nr:hypothetical protein [Mycolicibacterium sp.]